MYAHTGVPHRIRPSRTTLLLRAAVYSTTPHARINSLFLYCGGNTAIATRAARFNSGSRERLWWNGYSKALLPAAWLFSCETQPVNYCCVREARGSRKISSAKHALESHGKHKQNANDTWDFEPRSVRAHGAPALYFMRTSITTKPARQDYQISISKCWTYMMTRAATRREIDK